MGSIYIKHIRKNLLIFIILIMSLNGCADSTIFPDMKPAQIIDLYKKSDKKFDKVAHFVDEKGAYIIKNDDGTYLATITGGKTLEIKDKEINDDINYLLNDLGFLGISKNKNAIIFVRQSTLGFDDGIAYSTNGEKPNSDFIDKVEEIEKGWYYYSRKQD